MSSILRALKKLESDPRHQEETQPLDSKFVPLADTGSAKTAKGTILLVIGGGFVCGLVVLAGWWFFAEKMRPSPVVSQNISRQALQQPGNGPGRQKEAEAPESSVAAVAPAGPAADTPALQETAEQIPGAAAPENIMLPATPPAAQRTAAPVAEPVDEPADEPDILEQATSAQEIVEPDHSEEAAVAVTRAPEVPAAVKMPEIPVLNDPQMKLQAITWSKDPQKRIVVINNRILRQGETVMAYRIDTINQDDVLLSGAGKKWKLLFRIK